MLRARARPVVCPAVPAGVALRGDVRLVHELPRNPIFCCGLRQACSRGMPWKALYELSRWTSTVLPSDLVTVTS